MTLDVGTELGPYRLAERIGAGGMGEVFRAFDPRLGRDVAVKVFVRGVTADEAWARFEQEARIIARLSHPNILAIFDIGEAGDVRYIVTELLRGDSLRTRISRGRIPLDAALAIARQIALALETAHGHGIIHRDLKPENVFLLAADVVKLLDFGLAKTLPQVLTTEGITVATTAADILMGTLEYMAPEQARGQQCDARTDLFALGLVFYEMITGAHAFKGATPADKLAAILTADPPPASRLVPGLPRRVDAVIQRALAREPARRFQTARQFLEALDAVYSSAAERRPAEVLAWSAQPLPSVAVLPFADMSRDADQAYFCEGMAEEIITGLSRVPGLRVASRTSSFQFRDRDVNPGMVAGQLGVDAVLEGSVRTAGNRLRVVARLTSTSDGYLAWSEQFDRDLSDVFAVQDDIARAVVSALRGTLAVPPPRGLVSTATSDMDAYAFYLKGRQYWNQRTEAALERSVELFQKAIGLDPDFARAYAALADAYTILGVYGHRRPDAVFPQATAAAVAALERGSGVAEAYASLGSVRAIFEWDWDRAAQDFARAINLGPSYATGYHWYAMHCLTPLGRFEEALAALETARTLDPASLTIHSSIGLVHYMSGETRRAVDHLAQAIALDPEFSVAHLFLGWIFSERGEHERALEHLRRADSLTGGSPEVIGAAGYAHSRAGDRAAARRALEDLDALSAARYVSPGYAAQVHAGLGDEDAALAALEAAADLHAADLAWVKVRPAFARLRTHTRFDDLLVRMRLT